MNVNGVCDLLCDCSSEVVSNDEWEREQAKKQWDNAGSAIQGQTNVFRTQSTYGFCLCRTNISTYVYVLCLSICLCRTTYMYLFICI